MLQFKNVSHTYDKTRVIIDFSLDLVPNKVTSLLGSSGSGKTTILRLASGLENIQEGEIIFDKNVISKNLSSLKPEHRNIGYVFQDCALFPHLNVQENIFYGIKKENHQLIKKVNLLLKKNNFLKYKSRYPHELSGGQKQLVALFRAIASDPKLILMDEPFSNLDTRLREQVRDQILHILKDNKITTLLVTHDADEAMFMSDYIAILKDGSLEQLGTPLDLYRNPKSKFVTEFFGEINVFEGLLKNQKLHTVLGDFNCKGFENQKNIILVVRNDGFVILNDNDEDNYLFGKNDNNIVKCPNMGKVVESKFLGGSTIIHLSILDNQHHLHIKIPGINYFKNNQLVNIFTNTNYSYIFKEDKQGEKYGSF